MKTVDLWPFFMMRSAVAEVKQGNSSVVLSFYQGKVLTGEAINIAPKKGTPAGNNLFHRFHT